MKKEYKYLIATSLGLGLLALFSKKDKIMEIEYQLVWDEVSRVRILKLHPLIRDKVNTLINRVEKELGIKLRVVQGLRTWEEQAKLYAQGRTTPGAIVTNAKPGDSFHNYGLAVDVAEIKNGTLIWDTNWPAIVKIAKQLGFDWGGDFKNIVDKPHFEIKFGKSLAQIKQIYSNKQIENGYVKLLV